ncbi:MAG: 3'-5' exonuclease domain-containing protein 2 [Pseudoflavonifractor sp.]|nr:3'-5' exonuclease domain-containing protein 2 [Pseudoflavonifractor sp.]
MNTKTLSIAITKEQLSQMPVAEYPGHICVIDDESAVADALAVLRGHDVVGIDTETRPSFRKGSNHQVALVQIAAGDTCYLFRINRIGFVEALREFLEDDSIVKVGLSLKDDFLMLHKIADFEPRGYVELQTMVRDYCITDSSLQKIYAIIFGSRISKGQRLSNWEASELTPAQQVYAAIDAWACLRIYHYLKSGLFSPADSEYVVPPPAGSDNLPPASREVAANS